MNYRKARFNNRMCSVITPDEYMRLDESLLDGCVVEIKDNGKGYILPILPTNNTGIGIQTDSKDNPFAIIQLPPDEEYDEFSSDKIIDFSSSSNIEELMIKQKEFIEQEKNILMNNKEDITHYEIDDEDSSAMKAMKSAVNSKQIDIDLYKDRFGNNFANAKRKLKANDITLKMMNQIADSLDMKVTITIDNKENDVANPMPNPISIELRNDVK